MAVLHFSHSGVCVSDIERSTAFYRDEFGFTHFSFNVDKIAEVGRDVVAAGGRVMQEAQVGTPNDKSCVFVTDPDGCLTELVKNPAAPTPTPTT